MASAASEACKKYAAYGEEMLRMYGRQNIQQRLNAVGPKYDLEITAY